MVIHGIQKLTLVDYPGKCACILFSGACNFRCPFCQNGSLVLHPENEPVIDDCEIFEFLGKRRRMLEGVVVTGGEPTINKDLIPFLSRLKALGYSVKLDTNGYLPSVLKAAVESGNVDYVAMDIKTSLDEYSRLSGVETDTSRIEESIDYLLSGKVDYEFRTTVVNPLHKRENFEKIGKRIRGAKRYFLQSFVPSENTIEKGFESPSLEDIGIYIETLRSYIENVQMRDR
jgi:pyruvate formate lyase activating enzyme